MLGNTITSKESLLHEHVRDALVLLAKRQPMLRAVIATMADGDKYFEIKEMNEVIAMFDITISHVKASDWKDVWFEYTAKQRANGLLWRVVILQEQFKPDTRDYVNTLMFNFNHACTDGVSSVKFCKQFLNNMNELANGTGCVDQEISSLDLLPPFHQIVIRGRNWHLLYNFMLAYCGLRPILKFCTERLLDRFIEKKPNNPYHEQFPPKPHVPNSPIPSRLNVKFFTEGETKNIIQACKANNCTVTGAITTAAHLAFCELIQDDKSKNMKLESIFAINGQRFCDPKPHEDYQGAFVYFNQELYMKYAPGAGVDFWKFAQNTTLRIKEFVRKEECVVEATVISEIMEPREHVKLFINDKLFPKSGCNFISSFGSFHLGEQQHDTYKLHECIINNLIHNMNCTFFHFNYTINGKMTWQIVSNITVDSNHVEKFANLCFNRFSEMALGVV
ncbi:Hypothetical predicted protein [Paramuricea clavata]|uniref:Uncharacterized protein n=1 Tax=Paramuricea clavata TaxID=317549 RepID=A0A7D9D959_PARCT|nr:Hypothetical predicted protein [Paramuricea clavata]